MAEVHAPDRQLVVGDVGRKVRLMTGLDLTAYAAIDLVCKAMVPVSGGIVSWTVDSIEDPGNGVMLVVPVALTQTGQYQVQVVAAKTGAPTQASGIMDLWVDDKIV